MIYAGFWRRFAAACIDMVAYTPLYLLLLQIFPRPSWMADIVFIPIAVFTYAWFFASARQGSPGMWIMRFKVVTTDGQRISYTRAVIWGVIGMIGWLFVGAGLIWLQTHYDLDAINAYLNSGTATPDDPKSQAIFGTNMQDFMFWAMVALGSFFGLSLLWSFSIGLSKEKTGFQNTLCGTRFVRSIHE